MENSATSYRKRAAGFRHLAEGVATDWVREALLDHAADFERKAFATAGLRGSRGGHRDDSLNVGVSHMSGLAAAR